VEKVDEDLFEALMETFQDKIESLAIIKNIVSGV
jgi:hypothetical protein